MLSHFVQNAQLVPLAPQFFNFGYGAHFRGGIRLAADRGLLIGTNFRLQHGWILARTAPIDLAGLVAKAEQPRWSGTSRHYGCSGGAASPSFHRGTGRGGREGSRARKNRLYSLGAALDSPTFGHRNLFGSFR